MLFEPYNYISIYIKLSLYFSQDSILYSSKHKKIIIAV
nr:MAG TPA: hypothetical protein [Bacteriophage sp.]